MKILVLSLMFTLFSNITWADTELNLGNVLKCNVEGKGIETSNGPENTNVKLTYSKTGDEYRATAGNFEVSVVAVKVDGVLAASVFYGLMNSGARLSSSTGYTLINQVGSTDMGYLEYDGQMLTVTCSLKNK